MVGRRERGNERCRGGREGEGRKVKVKVKVKVKEKDEMGRHDRQIYGRGSEDRKE